MAAASAELSMSFPLKIAYGIESKSVVPPTTIVDTTPNAAKTIPPIAGPTKNEFA